MMSCLYPPPSLFFPFLFAHFLSPTTHLTFVWTKCWCLSYVFSAFGLFSYCLPGLFGSGPAQPVRCFSRFALLVCWSGHVFICLLTIISPPPACLSASLCLACLFPTPCGLSCCILTSHFPLLSSPDLLESLPFQTLHPLFFVCVPLNLHLWLPFFLVIQLEFSVVWNVPPCHVFISYFGLLISGHLFMSLHVFFVSILSYIFGQFWVVCAWLSPGLSGEHHEGEDAKERRTLVVLMEEQEQRLQISEYADTHINAEMFFRCNSSSALLTFCTSGISDRSRRRPRREFDHDALREQVTSESKLPHFFLKHQFSYFILPQIGCLCFFSGWRMSRPPVMRTTDRPIRHQRRVSQSSSWVLAVSTIRRLFDSPPSSWYVFLRLDLLTFMELR